MDILKRIWAEMRTPPTYAKCYCSGCNGELHPTSEMIYRDHEWFCSEEAYVEHRVIAKNW
jgi:hypothetical protein